MQVSLLSLREGIEAALDHRHCITVLSGNSIALRWHRAVWYGTLSAIGVSIITGILLYCFWTEVWKVQPSKYLKAWLWFWLPVF